MAPGINVVSLVGNLTRDPETRSAGDLQIAEFGLAVNGSVKKDGEWKDRPDYFDVVTFGGRARVVAEHLSKGSGIALSGRLRQDRWQNDAGDNRSKVKVIAEQIRFLGEGKPRSAADPSDEVPADTSGTDTESDDDQIPF